MRPRWTAPAMLVAALLTACAGPQAAAPPASSPASNTVAASSGGPLQAADKVMVIAEEDKTHDVVTSPSAPFLQALGRDFATLTQLDAGYPVQCPSLAAYILMTSGGTQGICDDAPPSIHPLSAQNIFSQLDAAGLPWRAYAESMPAPCDRENGSDDRYLVRHMPATYYLDVRGSCAQDVVPLGTPDQGTLAADLGSGHLPSYSFVTPDACNDMHGAPSCTGDLVPAADAWLQEWMPRIIQTSDFTSGRLVVIITWDEGSITSNHIPGLVISAHARSVTITQPG